MTRCRIEVHLGEADIEAALRADVVAGLARPPRWLPPKWFYDERGSALFDRITRLEEYYPTRTERGILSTRAAEVAELSGADTLVELGSGTSEKTRLLLDAMARRGGLRRIVLFDVSESSVRTAAALLSGGYPGAEVHGVVGDFDHHLDLLPAGGRRLVAFLGGTIGNLAPLERKRFLSQLSGGLRPGDSLLVGTDLMKDPARLRAAYDDAAGVTAAFNKNVLAVLNRRLGADFDLGRFDHEARVDADSEWVEMHLVATRAHVVRIPGVGLDLAFDAGESIRTEISAKFRRCAVEDELAGAGLEMARFWTDAAGDFAVSLALAR